MAQQPYQVLHLEDDAAFAEAVREMFGWVQPGKWEVTNVPSLEGALDHLHRQSYHLIIVDLNLLDSHGMETLWALRPVVQHAAVVVSTGANGAVMQAECYRLGAVGFFSKGAPIEPKEFVASVEQLVTERLATKADIVFIGEAGRALADDGA